MPWTARDVPGKTKKAKTPAQRRQWTDIANAALKRGLSEAEAIREANGVIANPKKRTRKTR
jgi:uncharacterized protein YdaT